MIPCVVGQEYEQSRSQLATRTDKKNESVIVVSVGGA